MKNIKLLFAFVAIGLLAFYYFQDSPSNSKYEFVGVKIYDVKDIVQLETHKTRDRDYNKNTGQVKKSFNEHYYYDIYLSNPSQFPEIKNVYEDYQYKTDGYISDNAKDDNGNAGYAVFEIYKNKETGKLNARLLEVRNDKKSAEIAANMRLDGIER